MTKKFPFLLGLFLVCMATLMLQIIQTRILSVVSMYYLAFLSIGMAMLGMTAGALVVYFKFGHVTPATVASYLSRVSTVFSLAILVCFLLQLASPIPILKVGTLLIVWVKVLSLLALPFAAAGAAVSLALTRSPFPVGVTYGVDLFGAAFGCLAVLALMHVVDAPSAIFVVAALAALAGVAFRAAGGEPAMDAGLLGWPLFRRPALAACALLVLATANAATRYGLQLISAKTAYIDVGTNYEFEKWNSFSRITVTPPFETEPQLWGRSPKLTHDRVVEQRTLSIDGFAGTVMPRFSGDPKTVDHLKYDVTNLAYYARPTGRVAVIGVGSGRDLLSAHVFGSRDITGVELNPIFVDLLTDPEKLRDYGGIADLPGLRLFLDEGRSWFARTEEKFDVIQMSMIDTFAATAAGAFSLSENGLYTAEGWRVFLSALSPQGLFTVSRWHAEEAPVEMGRTTSLAIAALYSSGVKNPREHIFLASSKHLGTLVISREPFTDADLRVLSDATERLGFEVLADPRETSAEPVFADLLGASSEADLNKRASNYWVDMTAPTDSRPFFFNQLRVFNLQNWKHFWTEYRRAGSFRSGASLVIVGNLVAIGTLFMLIALSLIAVVFAVVMPARSSIYNVDRRLAVLGSAYFLLIGLGFMFIEIGLIQRISVIMGHPLYALSVVLFSIILSTGAGSLLSEKLMPTQPVSIVLWLGLLVAYVLALPHWLPETMHAYWESAGLLTRSLVSVGVILPAGVFMGFGFPCGMRLVMNHDARPTPWFWGVNGAAGVLASGVAVVCSIVFSIDATLRVGAVCYLLLIPTAILLLTPNGQRATARLPAA
jgi:hypothetical protein